MAYGYFTFFPWHTNDDAAAALAILAEPGVQSRLNGNYIYTLHFPRPPIASCA